MVTIDPTLATDSTTERCSRHARGPAESLFMFWIRFQKHRDIARRLVKYLSWTLQRLTRLLTDIQQLLISPRSCNKLIYRSCILCLPPLPRIPSHHSTSNGALRVLAGGGERLCEVDRVTSTRSRPRGPTLADPGQTPVVMPFIDDDLLWCPDNDGKMVDLSQCL
ncbi:unnamed protein product, partial [Timema podura]|nr:unnamed protein product [Timema podura]